MKLNKEQIASIYEKLADVLDVEKVGESDVLGDFDDFDSLSIITLITFVDGNFQVHLYTDEISKLSTAKDFVELVDSKL